ncbi:Actin-related protein [Carpediemonas membranifera]|uniref:Actin-related protein n=1 Tax=Carpediemonas membranifera TaxID=201153 RepID=A0A8J6E1S8_9EUKA|nr:Actin-related protein [Carpediemonas membranifera]|eukprot:KAG9393431.1 Actin-related protein [Carpediemonas membranifera]
MTDSQTIVIDVGKYSVKAGLSGDASKLSSPEAYRAVELLELQNAAYLPEGEFSREQLETLYANIFKSLDISPSGQTVVLSEPLSISNRQRELVTQLMFETYNVTSMFSHLDACLALYGTGRASGIVVDVGCNTTRAIPIYDGYPIQTAAKETPVGGEDITELVLRLLTNANPTLNTITVDIARTVKERLALCPATPLDMSQTAHTERTFTLPDDTVLTVKSAHAEAGEALFTPSRVNGLGKNIIGIDDLVHAAYMAAPSDYRSELVKSISICGGGSMIKDIPDRLEAEVLARIPHPDTCILCPPDRGEAVWLGGSILASLKSFSQVALTKRDYDEVGPSIVHRKN